MTGEVFETAIWLDGSETPDTMASWKRDVCAPAFERAAKAKGVVLGPPVYIVKKPGDERCPPVPKWLEQRIAERGNRGGRVDIGEGEPLTIDGPRLLVCERVAIRRVGPVYTKASFLSELAPKDLTKLRAITKRQWLEAGGETGPLTDSEADAIIERLGPDAAADVIARQAMPVVH